MKKLLVAIAATALLSACGTGDAGGEQSATAPAPAPAPASATASATAATEASFLSATTSLFPGAGDAAVISLAHTVCDAFGRGVTYAELYKVTADGYSAKAADALITSAVATYCPDHAIILGEGARAQEAVDKKAAVAQAAGDRKAAAAQAAADKKAAAEEAAHPTIGDGQWEVGVDVPAGVYKVKEAIASGTCYWKIGPTGDPGKIIENDIVSGGRPTVTLSRGQDFTTTSCGTWAKR